MNGMNRKRIFWPVLLMAAMLLSTACGQEEYVVERGVGGYVYVSKRVREAVGNMKIAGDYLYYTQNGGMALVRVPIASVFPQEGRTDFSGEETVLNISSRSRELSDYMMESAGSLFPVDFGMADQKGMKCLFSLKDYAVDQEQNLYYYLETLIRSGSTIQSIGYILCRQNADGTQGYRLFLPEMEGLAVDREGKTYALTAGGIRIVDPAGGQECTLPIEGYSAPGDSLGQELFGDLEGRVYYCSLGTLERKTYEVVAGAGGGFELREAGGFLGSSFDRHAVLPGGNTLLYAMDDEQKLYEYDRETGATRKLLYWMDSGIWSHDIDSLAGISTDRLLVSHERGLYLLTRTPVEELPEREVLVLASPRSTMELQDAVMRFNQDNARYYIVIDDYGMSWHPTGWNTTRLDAALVSSAPPDFVDMSLLNIPKYAGKGVFEDLYPYLKGSSVLGQEDFLDGVLRGLTFDGALVCIASRFEIAAFIGASDRLGDSGSWTMEDVYALAEAHPEADILLGRRLSSEYTRDAYLREFCSHYYLERFVDWEKWECSFDSGEFCRMLEWVGEYAPDPTRNLSSEEIDALLLDWTGFDFYTLAWNEITYGEKFGLWGVPSVDGNGYFHADFMDVLGMVSGSDSKEGVWEFLEYYLTGDFTWTTSDGFSTRKALLQQEREKAMGEEPAGRIWRAVEVDGKLERLYAFPEHTEIIMAVIEAADFTPLSQMEEAIIAIVSEEAEYYFNGVKSLEEVSAIIQNRVAILLSEHSA